jgi:EmrB/QacA subfamily drug resistance transporter
MLAKGLIALDSTILATAVPSVVRELGAYEQFPWLFSAYLLAQAVSVPIYSKLADTIGRKPIILVGVGLFLISSVLAGLAWDMVPLIVFRALQGLGAGAVQPISTTIVGDLYSVEERGQVQGYLASVWAICSVIGPVLGGIFSEYISWRWIFWVNVPLCLIAGWALVRSYHESIEQKPHRIDYLGAATLTVGLSAVILELLQGGQGWAWTSWESLCCVLVGVLSLTAFAFAERRAVEPVLDLRLLGRPVIRAMSVISLGIGMLMTGVTSYAPTYLQNSIGLSPLFSGIAVAALALSWPASATFSAKFYMRYGYRTTILAGGCIAMCGTVGMAACGPWPHPVSIALASIVMGLGLGQVASPSLIASQSSVHWGERGVVTGLNQFARSAGSAIGVAIFGAIANNMIAAGKGAEDYTTIVTATTWVFAAAAVVSVLMWLASMAMPRGQVDDPAYRADAGM